MKLIYRISLICLFPVIHSVFAADIVTDVRSGGVRSTNDGGYLEIGFVGGYIHNPFENISIDSDDFAATIDVGGEYRYKDFFVEASQGTQDGFNLGYSLWSNEHWTVDVLGASINGVLSDRDDGDIRADDDEATRDAKLRDRDTFYIGAGVRITRYFENYVLQYRLVSDIFDGNGVVSTLRFGRGWQIRNWNFHTILSAEYSSEETNQYRFGITELEQTSRHPRYAPGASLNYSALFGVARPLSENWVLRGFAGYVYLPDEIRDSPLVSDHDFSIAVVAINYVF